MAPREYRFVPGRRDLETPAELVSENGIIRKLSMYSRGDSIELTYARGKNITDEIYPLGALAEEIPEFRQIKRVCDLSPTLLEKLANEIGMVLGVDGEVVKVVQKELLELIEDEKEVLETENID